MAVGGNFSSIDSVPCSVVCVLTTTNHQWSALGSGLSGEATDFGYIDVSMRKLKNVLIDPFFVIG